MNASGAGEGVRAASDVPEIREVLQGLSEKTYYRIGEVAKITRIKPYVLRFWETEFNVIAPSKSRSKQRMYRKKDIETILLIKHLLYKEGFTIKGARRRLVELGRIERDAVGPDAAGFGIAELGEIRLELEQLRELLATDS
jgi:DNA-binding transcriptional MerR regulator